MEKEEEIKDIVRSFNGWGMARGDIEMDRLKERLRCVKIEDLVVYLGKKEAEEGLSVMEKVLSNLVTKINSGSMDSIKFFNWIISRARVIESEGKVIESEWSDSDSVKEDAAGILEEDL